MALGSAKPGGREEQLWGLSGVDQWYRNEGRLPSPRDCSEAREDTGPQWPSTGTVKSGDTGTFWLSWAAIPGQIA